MTEDLDTLLRGIDTALHGWRKRSELRQTLRRVIEEAEERDRHRRCRDVIAGIARNHKTSREDDPSGCTLLPSHSILQIALRLSFECSLRDSEVVAALLTEVYHCEKTFERLFAGAIFGIGASYLITGWKSEFSSVADNAAAVEYFLQHATKMRLVFDGCRLGEVTMRNVGLSPMDACLQVGNVDMTLLLVKFGVWVPRRCLSPLTLLLLCKIRIRCLVHSNWELPFGLGKLPLPETLISYIETVDSELLPGSCPQQNNNGVNKGEKIIVGGPVAASQAN